MAVGRGSYQYGLCKYLRNIEKEISKPSYAKKHMFEISTLYTVYNCNFLKPPKQWNGMYSKGGYIYLDLFPSHENKYHICIYIYIYIFKVQTFMYFKD